MRSRPFFVAGGETLRYRFARALLTLGPGYLLYTRLAKPDLLKHDTRDRIYAHLQANPGLYLRSLRKDLSLPNGVLVHHLYRLEHARIIRRQRTGRRLQFYPAAVKPQVVEAIHPASFALLQAVQRRPGATQSQIAEGLQLSRQALNYHVQKLSAAGLLKSERAGRETHLSVDAAAWATVGRCGRCKTALRRSNAASPVRCPQCGASLAA